MTKRSLGLFGLLLCAMLLGGVARAQEQPLAAAPPPRIPVDAHGVNVVTGAFNTSEPLIAIGPSGGGGLSVSRQFSSNGWRESYIGTINTSDGVNFVVSVGGGSEVFSLSGSTYTNTEGGTSTLTYNSSTQQYTYTLADGTYLTFSPTQSVNRNGPWSANAGRLTQINHTDGQVDVWNYAIQVNCTGTGPPSAVASGSSSAAGGTQTQAGTVQPQTVQPQTQNCTYINYLNTITSNTGYQLTLGYANGVSTFDVTGITGANTATSSGTVASVTMTPSGMTTVTQDGFITRTYTYNTAGLMQSIQVGASPSATMVTLGYDSSNRVSTYNDSYYTYNYSYADSGATRTTTVTGPSGTKVYVSNTTTSLVSSFTDELSHVTSFTYDPTYGRLTQQTNPEGDYVVYGYDGRGNTTSTASHPKPSVGGTTLTVSANYDASCAITVKCNKPNSTLDAKGYETDYVYDPTHGGVTSVTSPAPSGSAPIGSGTRPQTRYSYTAMTAPSGSGSIYRLTGTSSCATTASCSGTADETTTAIGYDTNLLPTNVTQAAGNGAVSSSATLTWAAAGDLYTAVGPLGAVQTTRYRYGAGHQVLGVVGPDPDGSGPLTFRATRYTYDGRGLVTSVEQGTVPSQADSDWTNFSSLLQQTSTFDSAGNKLTDALVQGGNIQTLTQYSYNTRALFQCAAVRDPAYANSLPAGACTVTASTMAGADQIKQVTYDAASHVTSNIEGVGTSDAATVSSMTFGADGEQLTASDANGYLTTFVYDGFNRLATTQFPNPTVTGQSQTASTGIESYAHDANSNLTTLTRRGGTQVTYGYDNLNRTLSSSQTVTSGYANYAYGYDNFSRPIAMSTTSSGLTNSYSFAYDQLSRRTGETAPIGTATSTWDGAGRRTRLTWPDGFYVTYGYDTDGELTSMVDSTGATLASLAYDNLGRRTSLTRNSGVSTAYGYDTASRISSIAHTLPSGQSQTESYSYNVASQVLTKTGSNDGWAWNGGYNFNRTYGVNGLNQQTTAGSNTLTWGTKGTLTGDGTLTYSYDTNDQLFAVSNGSAQQYDAAGRLYSVGASGATRFLYDGSMAIAEYNSSGAVARRFVPGPSQDEPLVWYEGSGTTTRYGLTADRMGSITGITTDAGALSAVNSYDEYGIPGTANAGRFQYTGQKYLSEYGMYDYKARVYSPTLGRFVQPDPIGYGDGINFYQYVHSDPVNGTDPTGAQDCAVENTLNCMLAQPIDSGPGSDSNPQEVPVTASCNFINGCFKLIAGSQNPQYFQASYISGDTSGRTQNNNGKTSTTCVGRGRGLQGNSALAGKQGGIPGQTVEPGTAAVIPQQFGFPSGGALAPYAPYINGTVGSASFSSITDVMGGKSPIPGVPVRQALQQMFPGQLIIEIPGASDQGSNAPVVVNVPPGVSCPAGTSASGG